MDESDATSISDISDENEDEYENPVTSVRSSATSVQSNEKDQATCGLCQKNFTESGINIHRNACLKSNRHIAFFCSF